MPLLGGLGQSSALANEIEVHAFEQAQGFGIEAELAAPLKQPVDAVEELGMEIDRAVMRGEAR